jgi:TATA-box binding protein (TBP) (component of TFIID and TFIIIB)
MNELSKNVKELKLLHTPYVTTITICVHLNIPLNSLEDLLQAYTGAITSSPNKEKKHIEIMDFINSFFGGACNFLLNTKDYVAKGNKRSKSKQSFLNCVIFSLRLPDDNDSDVDDTKKKGIVSIKCFTNGSLHITGVKTINSAIAISRAFCILYDIVHGSSEDALYQIVSFKVQLINSHFSIHVGDGCIVLDKLFRLLLANTEHMCMYNSERHAGVLIKILLNNMRYVSIIVFDTGNILVSAFCDEEEFTLAWKFVIDFLSKNWNEIWIGTKVQIVSKVGRGKKMKRGEGFDYGKYIVLK